MPVCLLRMDGIISIVENRMKTSVIIVYGSYLSWFRLALTMGSAKGVGFKSTEAKKRIVTAGHVLPIIKTIYSQCMMGFDIWYPSPRLFIPRAWWAFPWVYLDTLYAIFSIMSLPRTLNETNCYQQREFIATTVALPKKSSWSHWPWQWWKGQMSTLTEITLGNSLQIMSLFCFLPEARNQKQHFIVMMLNAKEKYSCSWNII